MVNFSIFFDNTKMKNSMKKEISDLILFHKWFLKMVKEKKEEIIREKSNIRQYFVNVHIIKSFCYRGITAVSVRINNKDNMKI